MKTILYVEDDPVMLKLIGDILGREYRMLLAENPVIGLEMLSEETVDVVVTGNRLPWMIGTDFLEIVKDKYPVIVLSGSSDPDLPAKCEALGAVGFLKKPLKLERLVEMVRGAIQQSPARNGGR